ncbi:MAG: GAF domain-containing protein [Deltaproteobacteria bacterium]|nr:GAF domain-containing protein [Deltaproteobacteria bacterium]
MAKSGESIEGLGEDPRRDGCDARLAVLADACRRNQDGPVDVRATLGRLAPMLAKTIGDRCAIHVVGPGKELELAAVCDGPGDRPTDPVSLELPRAVLASGQPILEPGASGRRAIAVPILARGRVLGTICAFGDERAAAHVADDVAFLEGIATRAACALEASRTWQEQATATMRAEVAAERSQRLWEVTAALSEAVTSEQVAAVMAQRAVPALGGSCGAVALACEESSDLRVVALVDQSGGVTRGAKRIPLAAHSPLADAARTCTPVLLASREAAIARYPDLEDRLREWGCEAMVAFPVMTSRSVLGVLGLGYSGPRELDREVVDLAFLQTVATLCAQALDRARLYEAAQRERRRAGLLAETSRILSGSLDYRSTVEAAARCALTWFADIAAVDLFQLGAHDPVHTVIAGVDPELERLAREVREHEALGPSHPISVVLKTGRAMAVDTTSPPSEERDADPVRGERIRALGTRSTLMVPLTAHGTIGVMTFVSTQRCYGPDDVALAEELGRRAGVAIDHARLHARVRDEGEHLRTAHQQAREANRIKDDFLATVSHELRTPLNAILGWATLLRSRGGPEDIVRGLDVIERNARAQARIIEDVLDVSRIITGKLRLDFKPVDVEAVIGAAIDVVAPTAEAKGVDFEARVGAEGCRVRGDPDRLQQVVWNLLSNAVKFTPRGGRVVLGLERDGPSVRIQVADTGRGIDSDFLPHAFERFRQADSSPNRSHSGLGLGLAIVRHLVELHGGEVSAQSPGPDQGTTFTVRLPLLESDEPAGIAIEGQPIAPPASARAHPPALDRLHVLVCDDEPDARAFLLEALTGSGADVTSVASASEVLRVLASLRPDVLVSDIGMPQTDGYELMRRIRALPACDGGMIPAIALTAYARREDARRAFAVGYQRHVPKPVDVEELVVAVAEVLGRL